MAGDLRPSTRTFADSDGGIDHGNSVTFAKDRFKSALTANTSEQEIGIPGINLTNQRHTQGDRVQSLNAFHQK